MSIRENLVEGELLVSKRAEMMVMMGFHNQTRCNVTTENSTKWRGVVPHGPDFKMDSVPAARVKVADRHY